MEEKKVQVVCGGCPFGRLSIAGGVNRLPNNVFLTRIMGVGNVDCLCLVAKMNRTDHDRDNAGCPRPEDCRFIKEESWVLVI